MCGLFTAALSHQPPYVLLLAVDKNYFSISHRFRNILYYFCKISVNDIDLLNSPRTNLNILSLAQAVQVFKDPIIYYVCEGVKISYVSLNIVAIRNPYRTQFIQEDWFDAVIYEYVQMQL